MSTNLTNVKISESFPQLLHISGGPTATEKIVYSAAGIATALRLGTLSGSIADIQIVGNVIQATEGELVFAGSVAFEDAEGGRTALGLGSMATQSADDVAISGGSIQNVSFSGAFSGMELVAADELVGGTVQLSGDTISSTEESGEIRAVNLIVESGEVPFDVVTDQAYASFYDAGTTDQTGSTTARTAIKWATAAVAGAGVTVASNSRITMAAAGVYRINASLQFFNSDNTVRTVDLWFAKNGTNIPDSAARITVPANNAGGTYLAAYEIFVDVAEGDYVEMYWYPSNVSAKLHYIAPVTENPGVTPAIPAIPPAIVVVQRIA